MADQIRNQLLALDDATVFEVNKVKDIRLWGGKIEYLVNWANTPFESEATFQLLYLWGYKDKQSVTHRFNKERKCREIVWPDSWVKLEDLDCHELIMQFHIDAKNGLKDEVSKLTDELVEVKEENQRLKSTVESLKKCVMKKQKR